jgi:hypothetical protein
MDANWEYLRRAAMTVGADMMANPLRQTELQPHELLVREAIQNSLDERRADSEEPVRFLVERKSFLGAEKSALAEAFKLRELAERIQAYEPEQESGWLKFEESCLASLDDPDAGIPVVFLSDHNTNGLGGNWRRREGRDSRFHNLVLSVYASNKAEETGETLGSYGIGKMVYAVSSKIRTMAYYSTFAPSESSEENSARLMATAFLPEHNFHDSQYTGHAFLGPKSEVAEYPARPLADENAHAFIKDLGLKPRKADDTGLTVMLLDCDISPADCRDACERYWWPRLIDNDVILEFKDEGENLPAPNPTGRKEIRPFLDCYRNTVHGVKPEGYVSTEIKLKGTGKVGHMCLKPLDEKAAKANTFANTVALIRNGLVIQYNPEYAREGDPDAAGTFLASHGPAGKAFKLSEPEAHDFWNKHSDRLRTSLGEEGNDLVRRTHERIKTEFRDFQTRLKDIDHGPQGKGLDFIDDLLGSMFKKRKKGPAVSPEPARRAFSIQKRGWRDTDADIVQDRLEFKVALTPDLPETKVTCSVKASLQIREATEGSPGEFVPCNIFDEDDNLLSNGKDAFTIDLEAKTPRTLNAVAQVHPSWRTRWVVNVARNDPLPEQA